MSIETMSKEHDFELSLARVLSDYGKDKELNINTYRLARFIISILNNFPERKD